MQVVLGLVEEAVVVERAAAADVPVGHDHLPAGVLEGFDAGDADVGVQVVVERVREQHDRPSVRVAGAAAAGEPLLQRHRRERRQGAVLVDAGHELGHPGQAGSLRGPVDQLRDAAGQCRPPVDEPEGVGVAGPPAPGGVVVVVQEFSLVGGHVDVDRAVVRAALAGQAQVERVEHLAGLPAVGDRLAAQHLEQQPGPAPGGVLFVAGGPVAGAHGGVRLGDPALADADAAQRSVREVAAVFGVAEPDRRAGRVVVGAELEVLVHPVGVDDLPRVHGPGRVPDALELTHSGQQRLAVLLDEQFGLLLTVAVLTGQRAAVGDDQVGGLAHERAVVGQPVGGAQVEADPRVHAALPEVAVQGTGQPVPVVERLQIAKVGADLRRRDGRVFPAGPVVLPVGREGGGAEPAFPDGPQVLTRPAVLLALHHHDAVFVVAALAGEPLGEFPRLPARLVGGLGAELHEQPAAGRGVAGQLGEVRGVHAEFPLIVDQAPVDAFQADRAEPVNDVRDVVAGVGDRVVSHRDQGAFEQAGAQLEPGLQHGDARALGTHQRASDVEALLRQQLVEVEPGDPARQIGHRRVTGADLGQVAVTQIPQLPVDLALAPAGGDDLVQLLLLVDADPEPLAVVGDDLQCVDVVRRAWPGTIQLRLHRVHTAGVVAQVAADRAPRVRRRVGPEHQPGGPGVPVELLVDHARLALHGPGGRVGLAYLREVLRAVDDHGVVHGLAGQAGAAAAVDDRGTEAGADPVRGHHVIEAARHQDADGDLAKVRRVIGVHRQPAGVEADLAGRLVAQGALQAGDVDLAGAVHAAGGRGVVLARYCAVR